MRDLRQWVLPLVHDNKVAEVLLPPLNDFLHFLSRSLMLMGDEDRTIEAGVVLFLRRSWVLKLLVRFQHKEGGFESVWSLTLFFGR